MPSLAVHPPAALPLSALVLMDSHTRYELVEVIGKGSFGEVYRGLDTIDGREVAVKVIDLEDIEEDIGDIQREIGALRTCRSPNITQYYGSALMPGSTKLLIAMELMAASLADVVCGDGVALPQPLPEPAIAYVLREVLNALVYLHAEQRIHRDIKAANILVSDGGDIKVSDFGVSAQLTGTVSKRRTFVGSPLWMAPEVIEQSPDTAPPGSTPGDGYDEAADIWSLGITAIELAMGEPPRANVGSFRLLFMIVRDDPPLLEGHFSTDLMDFVWQCLRKDPKERPSAMDLLQHPFVANAEKPPELEERITAYLASRPALAPDGGDGAAATMQVLPKWDFGGTGAAGPAAAAAATSTVVSAKPPRPSTSGNLTGTVVARPATAPNGAGAPAGLVDTIKAVAPSANGGTVRRHTDSDANGTVVAKRPSAAAEAAAPPLADSATTVVSRGSGQQRRIQIPNDPRVPDLASDGSRLASSAAATVRRLPAGAASGRPDSSPLRLLVQPALTSASGGSARAVAAAEAALAALSALETAQPGATRSALTDMLALLSVSSSPALAPLKSSAAAVFGSASEGATDAIGQPSTGGVSSGVADLGPLGNFLMVRWREDAARERAESCGRAAETGGWGPVPR